MPSRPLFPPARRRPAPSLPGRRRRNPQRGPRGPHVSLRADVTGTGGLIIGSTAVTSFEHHQVPSDIVVEVDWDNDGDFDQADENITGLVLDLETFTGRDWPSQLTGKAGAGRLSGTLNNTDGRFSYFNQDSPLNTDPFSLQLGRRIRVRTTEAANPDPVLLARDRFRRPDGALIATENGLPWVAETADEFEIVGEEAVATNSAAADHAALVDIGVNDAYLQATHGTLQSGGFAGIYYRYQDASNHGWVTRHSNGLMSHYSVVAGVSTQTDYGPYPGSANRTSGAVFGVGVNGSAATIYLEGVPIGTATAAPFASTRVGMSVLWLSSSTERPSIRSFTVWDELPEEIEGILWTGQISEIEPRVGRDQSKVAAIRAEGPLAAAATVDVDPQPAVAGNPTGIAVGHVLGKANLAAPPGRLHKGDITTGPYGFPTSRALDVARQFEDTELGFLYETQEGYVNFDARTARDSSYSLATFSDHPGTQYGYEGIEPRDWRNEIFNQVRAGVAPGAPSESVTTFEDSAQTAGGVANDVNVTLPSGLDEGKLVVLFITSTVGFTGTVPWLEPIWWVEMRPGSPAGRQRVYAHICDGSESGDNVLFYDDTAASGGNWQAHGFVIPRNQWYGSHDGISLAQHNPGPNPPALVVPWGLAPTMFIASYCGMVSIAGGSMPGWHAAGYSGGVGAFLNGVGSEVFDMFQAVEWKTDIRTVEDPSFFGSTGVEQYVTTESTVLAIRGFNGDPIPETQLTTVTRDDTASQDAHDNTVRTLTGPNLFRHPAAAGTFCDRVLGRYANDRPIFEIGFTATKSGAYRSQATRRRVGHRITLEADTRAGMGVNQDFHIESIRNRFREGTTVWEVAWELSPAENVNRADTTASELAAGIDTEASTFTVTVTDGPLWITATDHPHMFPFRAVCESEVWLVTAISGQTATQTWTVQRAFNGFPQAHSAGAAVNLFDQWTLP